VDSDEFKYLPISSKWQPSTPGLQGYRPQLILPQNAWQNCTTDVPIPHGIKLRRVFGKK
jgi:hypothetical protein